MYLAQANPKLETETVIKKPLNRNLDTIESDLKAIREWLNKQPHLPKTIDNRRLLSFLRGCRFSLERCKQKLDNYFSMKAALPEFFTDRDVTRPEMKELLDYAYAIYLPALTSDGARVFVTGTTRTEFKTPDMATYFKYVSMQIDVRLEEGISEAETGDIYIFDASVALAKHVANISLTTVKKFLICMQEIYPFIIKDVHIVNAGSFFDFCINFVKSFLKEKLRDRIHVHSDLNSLHKYVSKDILPEEFGGNAGKLNDLQNECLKKLEEKTSWFKEQETCVADETRRLGKSRNYEEIFGVEGSFRQLSID